MLSLFTTGVFATNGKFTVGVTEFNSNLVKDMDIGVIGTGGKFTAGMNDTAGVVDTSGAPCRMNIFADF